MTTRVWPLLFQFWKMSQLTSALQLPTLLTSSCSKYWRSHVCLDEFRNQTLHYFEHTRFSRIFILPHSVENVHRSEISFLHFSGPRNRTGRCNLLSVLDNNVIIKPCWGTHALKWFYWSGIVCTIARDKFLQTLVIVRSFPSAILSLLP